MSAYYHETNGHNGMSIKQRNGNGDYSKSNSVDDYMNQEEEWNVKLYLIQPGSDNRRK